MFRLPPADDKTTQELFSRITASRGWVSNLLRSLAHSSPGLAALQQVGHFGRYETDLTERERELAIVITGRDVPYAYAHHAPLARQVGITDAQLDAIRAANVPEGLSPAETALCAYCFQFTACKGIDDACFSRLREFYSNRQVTDITILCAYYLAMGSILIGFEVQTEPPEVLQIELDWQKANMA